MNNEHGKIFLWLESGYRLQELKGFSEREGPVSLSSARFSSQSVKLWLFLLTTWSQEWENIGQTVSYVMVFPKGQYKNEIISFCQDKKQQHCCSTMFTLALGSFRATQAESWDPVIADPLISLYSLPQLIPSQILLCNIIIKNPRSGLDPLWLERETRLSLWGGESFDFNVSLFQGFEEW